MSSDENMMEVRTHYGKMKWVPINQFRFRPSVYAIVMSEDKILLVKSRRTGKYMLPGGGVELGETNEAAVVREVQEETGISVSVQAFLRFTESFFFHDPHNAAYHGLFFYYLCLPLSTTIPDNVLVDDEEAVSPIWLPIDKLKPEDLHNHGDLIVQMIKESNAG